MQNARRAIAKHTSDNMFAPDVASQSTSRIQGYRREGRARRWSSQQHRFDHLPYVDVRKGARQSTNMFTHICQEQPSRAHPRSLCPTFVKSLKRPLISLLDSTTLPVATRVFYRLMAGQVRAQHQPPAAPKTRPKFCPAVNFEIQ